MNGPERADILAFVERVSGRRLTRLHEADVLAALDIDGEAARAFIEAFAKEFSVDLTGYEPRFHHRDETRRLRPGWPLPAKPLFGVRLPLGVTVLTKAAQSGRWPVVYPVLGPKPSRHWLNVPLILIGLPVLAILLLGLLRLV
ncbi:MAG: hypothetical protein MUC82_13460 [Cypionkella sp.]|nr:hypothetical protein [Cypionkella sp.]